MNVKRLDKIIKQFWKNERYNDIYYLGLCSEMSVALKRFLGAGTLYKRGILHTVLKYKNHYCEVRGCMNQRQLLSTAPGEYLRPASNKEIAHIYNLLKEYRVKQIVKGLKKAERQIK